MRPEAILVELDGIVIDTFAPRRQALNEALRGHQVELTDAEYWDWCAGWPSARAIEAIARERHLPLDATDLELARLRADRALAASLGKGTMLADGARSALERLASRHRLAGVTRLRRADVAPILELARLEHAFSFVIGAEDATADKPDPAPYHLAVRRLGQYRSGSSGTVVALENGAAGIRSAQAAGLACIAVGPHPAHVALEASAYVPSLAMLDSASLAALLTPPRQA
ncbi:MAG: HAD family phosphatase [Gemmatimonadetes bacterium]|nr:HAD family phosphatase [Gemmatimonadota bacterium]